MQLKPDTTWSESCQKWVATQYSSGAKRRHFHFRSNVNKQHSPVAMHSKRRRFCFRSDVIAPLCSNNWARQESVGQEISEVSFVCFMHHFTCWILFISRIDRAWLYKGLNDSHRQPNSDIAQLAQQWWSGGCWFKPHWGKVLTKFILFCVTLDLSDNLTEMRIVKK